jgi:hypothetical protein
MPGAKFDLCRTSPVGTTDADAPPASEKVNPAAPNAGTAVLVTRFFFEACFTRCMVASSNVARRISVKVILRRANKAGKIHAHTKM